MKVHLHLSSKIKVMKSQNSRNQGFYNLFLLDHGRSGSVQIITDPDPGGPKSCGSYAYGSGSTTLVASMHVVQLKRGKQKHMHEQSIHVPY